MLSFLSILFLSPPAVRADYKIVVGDFGIINVFPMIANEISREFSIGNLTVDFINITGSDYRGLPMGMMINSDIYQFNATWGTYSTTADDFSSLYDYGECNAIYEPCGWTIGIGNGTEINTSAGLEWFRSEGTTYWNFYTTGDDTMMLFEDNVTFESDVTMEQNLNVTGNITGNLIRGIMGYHNHTGTTLYFEDTEWLPLFFTGTTVLNGFTFTGGFMSSSNLTAQVAGIYWATYRVSGSGQNNHIYFSTVLVNGTNVNEYCGDHKKIAAGGDIVPMGNTCEIRLNVGDNVTVAVMDYGGSGNGDYYSSNLNLVRIGD